jgi:hypothetical protein
MSGPPDKPDRSRWDLFFPEVKNFELKGLYSQPLFTAVQLRIILYLLTQTRGTPEDEYDMNSATFGRETAAVKSETIAAAIGDVNIATIWRELRRLECAGVVVVHERGRRGKQQVLSLNLDPSTWRSLSTWDEKHPGRALAAQRRSAAPAERPALPARERPVDNSTEAGTAAEKPALPAREYVADRQGNRPDTLAGKHGGLKDLDLSSPFGGDTSESTSDPDRHLPQQSKTSSEEPTICARARCGAPLPAKNGRGQPRKYCSGRCARSEEKRRRRERDRALKGGESAAVAVAGFKPAMAPGRIAELQAMSERTKEER